MGKGDIKTRRGKIFRGTYGVSRKRRKMKKFMPQIMPAAIVPEIAITAPEAVIKPKAKPKVAKPKKTTAKKVTTNKATPKKVEKKTRTTKKPVSKREKS